MSVSKLIALTGWAALSAVVVSLVLQAEQLFTVASLLVVGWIGLNIRNGWS
jgi:hypothetical protein